MSKTLALFKVELFPNIAGVVSSEIGEKAADLQGFFDNLFIDKSLVFKMEQRVKIFRC